MALGFFRSLKVLAVFGIVSFLLASCSSSSSNSSASNTNSGSNTTISTTSSIPSPTLPVSSRWHVQYALPFGGVQMNTFLGISCANLSHCQAIGGDKNSQFMLGTGDGGLSWIRESDPPSLSSSNSSGGTPPGVSGIACPSVIECFALTQNQYSYSNGNTSGGGLGAAILATYNGGKTWAITATLDNTDYFNSISCISTEVCYVAGDGFVAASFNGGFSWTKLQTVPQNLPEINSISCYNMYDCVGVSTNHILISKDEGRSWTKTLPPKGVTGLTSISCPSFDLCYALGGIGSGLNGIVATGSNVVIATDNGGLNWTIVGDLPNSLNPIRIRCISSKICYVVGYVQSDNSSNSVGGIFITYNGAKSWNSQAVPAQVSGIQDISCIAVNQCWAVGGATQAGSNQPGNFVKGFILSNH